MSQSFFLYAPKIIFDLLFDLLYFLPWWYSRGLLRLGKKSWRFLKTKEEELAIIVWLKSLHRPLYENYGWQGMAKSVIMRIGQIIFRSLILSGWTAAALVAIIVYVLLPLLAVWEIIYQVI